MNRLLLGAILALGLVGIGAFWWQGRAAVELGAPPPIEIEIAPLPLDIPIAEDIDLVGPTPPEATDLSREQRRFFRYDRDRDQRISRNEMLSTRTNAFRALDTDGNNLLSFEEWAVTTVRRFDKADANGNRELTPEEFATTKPKAKPKRKPACRC